MSALMRDLREMKEALDAIDVATLATRTREADTAVLRAYGVLSLMKRDITKAQFDAALKKHGIREKTFGGNYYALPDLPELEGERHTFRALPAATRRELLEYLLGKLKKHRTAARRNRKAVRP